MNQEGHAKIMSALEALSAIADSFKTGISGQDAQQFLQTASELQQMLLDRDRLAPVVQVIFLLGKFLAAHPLSAHQGAVSLLEKQLKTLSTLVTDRNPDPVFQDRLVKESIKDFKAFRESISLPAPDPRDLEPLKAVLLSIDWEITSGSINQFNEICGRLLHKWGNRSIYVNLLKVMKSLVAYIGRKKADTPADSIDLLKSVFAALETMVHNPQLKVSERKQLYNKQIERFNRFKEMALSSPKQAAAQGGQTHSEILQDMPPALSHINHGTKKDHAGASELTLLNPDEAVVEPVSRKKGEGDIQPALQGMTGGSKNVPNVMDDLLNPRETEADKMLDTIHLMDVGGTNPSHNQVAMEADNEALKPGMNKITPSKKHSVPIPEIEQALNEFFHLDTEPDRKTEAGLTASSASHETAVSKEIVEDIADGSGGSLRPAPPHQRGEADMIQLGKLEEVFCRSLEDLGETGHMDVLNDLDKLKVKWMDDPVKSNLVNLIDLLFNRLWVAEAKQGPDRVSNAGPENSGSQPPGLHEPEPQNSGTPAPEPPPKKGMLSKLKRFFSS